MKDYIGTAGVLLGAYVSGKLNYDELARAVSELSRVIWSAEASS